MTPVKMEVLNLERDTAGTAEHQQFIVSGPNTDLFVCTAVLVVDTGYGMAQREGSRRNRRDHWNNS